MIGLILGTSEGRKIVSLLNEFTDNLFISTATAYGGEILKDFKYRVLNSKPLKYEELIQNLKDNKVSILVDASHPYAVEITKNAQEACKLLEIEYLRYERPSVLEKFKEEKIIEIKNYEELKARISQIRELEEEQGAILNTCGSRNIEKILDLKLGNRIIHRVLPSVDVMEKCLALGIKVDDIVAIKGPISYDLNCSFIKEYNAKAIIMKDSGIQGGTDEKIRSALDMDIYAFVLARDKTTYDKAFSSEEELVNHIRLNHSNFD